MNKGTLAAFAILLSALPARAASPARADIASMEFTRTQAPGLELQTPRPGTRLTVLLTHADTDWRALDLQATRITAFADDRGATLATSDAPERPAGLQAAGSFVSSNGGQAVLSVWGGELPGKGAHGLRITGSAAIFCGSSGELSADRADVRFRGGETFNVQPFRVVTSRDGELLGIELRYLKSAAYVSGVTVSGADGPLTLTGESGQASAGDEWVWRGRFVVPPRGEAGAISVRYLPIERVETIPFDLSAGLAFKPPPTNPILRWLKRYL